MKLFVVEREGELFESDAVCVKLQGLRILLASTDVHAHAISTLAELLHLTGVEVMSLGAEQDVPKVMMGLSTVCAGCLVVEYT